ncbi:hypothetical protein M569_07804, partial [Genlisea aurea]
LLDTVVNNCGDIVHMYIAEKELPYEMLKIVRKKKFSLQPDLQVKEKILTLMDAWQRSFGRSLTKYPQYISAYQELLRLGAVFPQRCETSAAPVLTPAQTRKVVGSYPHNSESSRDAGDSSGEAEFPTLSLTEIQNARGVMDVVAEMLLALNLDNKEGLKQDVMVDLIEQCRTYKQRVVHLVNSTSDESLLCQGLALNDDLQRLLAKHESLVSSGGAASLPLINVGSPLIDTSEKTNDRSKTSDDSVSGTTQLLVPAAKGEGEMDLLSGDGMGNNCVALVPVGGGEPQQQPSSPVSPQNNNVLSLVVSIPQPNNSSLPQQSINNHPGSMIVPCQHFPWMEQQQLYVYVSDFPSGGSATLPPPPWEVQPEETTQQQQQHHQQLHVTVTQVVVNQSPPQSPTGHPYIRNDQPAATARPYIFPNAAANHPSYYYQMGGGNPPQQMIYSHHHHPVYGNEMPGYGYHQQGNNSTQFVEQGMSGLSIRPSSYMPPGKALKPEDKLFGELVDISKFK